MRYLRRVAVAMMLSCLVLPAHAKALARAQAEKAGTSCSTEGAMGYDYGAHRPVYCGVKLKWNFPNGFSICRTFLASGKRGVCGSTAEATCPDGWTLTGGGGNAGSNATLQESFPAGNTWYAVEHDLSGRCGQSNKAVAYAVCCQ